MHSGTYCDNKTPLTHITHKLLDYNAAGNLINTFINIRNVDRSKHTRTHARTHAINNSSTQIYKKKKKDNQSK